MQPLLFSLSPPSFPLSFLTKRAQFCRASLSVRVPPQTHGNPNRSSPVVNLNHLFTSWKLIYSSANCSNGSGSKAKGAGSKDRLTSIEDISYVSENYRLSHSDDNVLRVYRRVVDPPARAPVAATAAGDDTMVNGGAATATAMGGGKKKAGRAAAAAAAASGMSRAKQPLRKRMFFGFLRR